MPDVVNFQVAFHRAGLDRRDADLAADLLAQTFGDGADREFGARIERAAECEDLDARNRTEVDDVAALLSEEPREGSRDALKRTFEIDVDHRIPLVGIDLGHRPNRH